MSRRSECRRTGPATTIRTAILVSCATVMAVAVLVLHATRASAEAKPGSRSNDGRECAGAVFCEATYREMEAAGFDTTAMRARDAAVVAGMQRDGTLGGDSIQTTYDAWLDFSLYFNANCSGTVKDNSYCGWLYHKYVINGVPPIHTTSFPARSGDDSPSHDWTPNVGPIPNEFTYTWGFMNGAFTGYEPDSSDSFYPGKWRLDPWSVTKPGGTTKRGAFEIHGGRGAHSFWTTRTAGCIRLPASSITTLKGKWDSVTSNKASGVSVLINY